jgi:hypothetical protein
LKSSSLLVSKDLASKVKLEQKGGITMDNAKLPSFSKTVFIGLSVLVVLAFVACEKSSSPPTPSTGEAILVHPEGRAVPVAETKEYLDQFMEWGEKTLPLGLAPQEDQEELLEESQREYLDLIESDMLVFVASGTECRVLEAGPKYSEVKILEGPDRVYGGTFWVFSSTIRNQKKSVED